MPRPNLNRTLIIFGGTFAFAAALYVASAARGPAIADWGDFVAAAAVLGIPHPTGYAVFVQVLAFPAALSPEAAATAANALNALLVAAGPAVVALWAYALARGASGVNGRAAFAVVMGALSAAVPSLWLEATSVEVYGAALALVLGAFYLLFLSAARDDGRRFVVTAFIAGLAAGVHLTAFTYILALLAVRAVAGRAGAKAIWPAAAACALGLSATLYIPLRAAAGPPLSWSWVGPPDLGSVLHHVAGRQFSYHFRWPTRIILQLRLWEVALAIFRNAGPLVILAPAGAVFLWRRNRAAAAALAAVAALNVAYLFAYDIPDLADYRLPITVLVVALGAGGAAALFGRLEGRRLRAGAVALAAAALAAVVITGWPRQRRFEGFVDYYGREVASAVGKDGTFFSGSITSNFLFWYNRYVLGRRPDITFYNVNDGRYTIEKLRDIAWRERGAGPVFADYLFVEQTTLKPLFYASGRCAGFVMELTARETGAAEARVGDEETLAAAAAFLAGAPARDFETAGAQEMAAGDWVHHGLFHEGRQGEAKEAGYYFARAAALAPDMHVTRVDYAWWLYKEKRYDDAEKEALAAAAADHSDYVPFWLLAMVARDRGDMDASLAYARKAVAVEPREAAAHNILAFTHLARGETGKARVEFERTVSLGFKDADTVLALTSVYIRDGTPAKALALLADATRVNDDPRLFKAYASLLIEAGRYAEAKTAFERAAALAPGSPDIEHNLSRLRAMGW